MSEEKENLFRHFEKYIKLGDALKDELGKRVHYKMFKKGELVFNAATVCTKSYFIEKGLLRTYFIKDGKEITEYFCSEGEWVNSPRSFMQRKVDIYDIDAIEDTSVFTLHVNCPEHRIRLTG